LTAAKLLPGMNMIEGGECGDEEIRTIHAEK
jgi:hypothetical protein